jgi:hypothetical protein
MESGQTYVFRFEPNGARYQITTLGELGMPAAETIQLEVTDTERDASDMLRLPKSELPDGVVFAGGDISSSSQVMATLGTTGGGVWSAPILFHPDGTTSDASLVLANDELSTVRVTLRGLTGISQTSEVGKEKVGP